MATAKPCPVDFQTVAAGKTANATAAHYRVKSPVVARWAKTQPQQWQDAWTAAAPALRRAALIANSEIARQRSLEMAHEKAALQGRKVGQRNRIRPSVATPIPEGFFEVALVETADEAGRQLGLTSSMVKRMIARLPDDQRAQVIAAGHARKASAARVNKKKRDTVVKVARKALQIRAGFVQSRNAAAPIGYAYDAARVLQKAGYVPVVVDAGKVYGKHMAGVCVVGKLRLTQGQMIELARRHGYNPDAWRALS